MTQMMLDMTIKPRVCPEKDEGPWGVKWRDGNWFMFECKFCGKITSSGISETSHEKGCGHPYAK